MTKKMRGVCSLAVLGLFVSLPGVARAADDLITNGGFETTTGGTTGYIDKNGFGVTGWTNTNYNQSTLGYNFIFDPATASTTGAAGIKLWGPGGSVPANTYSANGLTASPDGGNFLAADGAYETAAITQTVSGLVPGAEYAVSFYYGGAQQSGFTGDTTEAWKVSLGGGTAQETPILSNVSHGFTGWQSQTFDYIATSSSEVLSFLAVGTPNGEPPFTLLDGVSLESTPEPSAVVAMFAGVIGVGLFARRRSRTKKSAK